MQVSLLMLDIIPSLRSGAQGASHGRWDVSVDFWWVAWLTYLYNVPICLSADAGRDNPKCFIICWRERERERWVGPPSSKIRPIRSFLRKSSHEAVAGGPTIRCPWQAFERWAYVWRHTLPWKFNYLKYLVVRTLFIMER